MPQKAKPRATSKTKTTGTKGGRSTGTAARSSKNPADALMEKLKTFVRSKGADYLRDPNISSVGIGYKQVKGKATKEIAIQFTVNEKRAQPELEALNTQLIPETILVDGVSVPTDVLERTYALGYKILPAEREGVASDRKVRIDPIKPGVSVANAKETAGTLGCIVYDKRNGKPYILSNWHVLHGLDGKIGDEIVQPGPYDDNRVTRNHLGKLIRSHLGAAGDCAIASIENRGFDPEVLELNLSLKQLGDAELGDKVIKSGRTTGVTHGIVTRVNILTKIDYGGSVGEQAIGGFEIGPDPSNPPENGEVSMGGDSGSSWLFKTSNGRPSTILAGLHFAGEISGDPNEHAVACYPHSVFEKLEITLTPPAIPDDQEPQDKSDGASPGVGYNPRFLGVQIDLPKMTVAGARTVYQKNGSEVINYTHFSLAMHKERRFAVWVAWNIDGNVMRQLSRKGIPFILDPNVPARYQIGDELYAGNRLDRGHIARRADLCWGNEAEARRANKDSFFFTNMTPQMDDFNQSSKAGIWGQLEDAIFSDVDVTNLRVSVFGGPIFNHDDREYRNVKIPREFYKVLVYKEGQTLKAKGFLLTQNLNQLEALELDEFRVFEVTLAEIEQRCQFKFSNALKAQDGFEALLARKPEGVEERQPLESVDAIRW
jgi:endonuclease G, mitochondrial